mgnify:CR=1 FL=1
MKFEEEWSFLNPYQMTAVLDESPACVVNANVGSGKTILAFLAMIMTAENGYQSALMVPTESWRGSIMNRSALC